MLNARQGGIPEDIDEAGIAIPLPDIEASSCDGDVVSEICAQTHEDML